MGLHILAMNLDTTTSTGRLMLNLLGFIAEFERDLMLEHQKEGIAKAKAEGKYKGRTPTAQRKAERIRLEPLLELFRVSEVSAVVQPAEITQRVWSEILSCEGMAVLVADADGTIVATYTLITAPNLLREGRGHGFLEYVVTHPDYRGRGHGRAVVQAALDEAWANNCYHVLLQSGRKDPRVQRFYEACGFRPGLRIGYVASRPS